MKYTNASIDTGMVKTRTYPNLKFIGTNNTRVTFEMNYWQHGALFNPI